MNKKKILAMLMSLSICGLMLTACSEDSSKKDSSDNSSETISSSVEDSSQISDVDSNSTNDENEGLFIPTVPQQNITAVLGEEVDADESYYEKLREGLKDGEKTLGMYANVGNENAYIYITTDGTNTFSYILQNDFEMVFLDTPDKSYLLDTKNKKYLDDAGENIVKDFDETFDTLLDGKYEKSVEVVYGEYTGIAECISFENMGGNDDVYFIFDDNGSVIAVIGYNEDGTTKVTNVLMEAKAYKQNLTLPKSYTEMTPEDAKEWLDRLNGIGESPDTIEVKNYYDKLADTYKNAESYTISYYFEYTDNTGAYFITTTNGICTYSLLSTDYEDLGYLEKNGNVYKLYLEDKEYIKSPKLSTEIVDCQTRIDYLLNGTIHSAFEVELEDGIYYGERVLFDNGYDSVLEFVFDENGECIGFIENDAKAGDIFFPATFETKCYEEQFIIPEDFINLDKTDTTNPNDEKPEKQPVADSQYESFINKKDSSLTVYFSPAYEAESVLGDFDLYYTTDGTNQYLRVEFDDYRYVYLKTPQGNYFLDEDEYKYYSKYETIPKLEEAITWISGFLNGTYIEEYDISNEPIGYDSVSAEKVDVNGTEYIFTFDRTGYVTGVLSAEPIDGRLPSHYLSIEYESNDMYFYDYVEDIYDEMSKSEFDKYISNLK